MSELQFTAVKSSHLNGYARRGNELVIHFQNGSVYGYAIPEELYQRFVASASKGQFFHAEIKNLFKGSRYE